jgi:hypothetical protein
MNTPTGLLALTPIRHAYVHETVAALRRGDIRADQIQRLAEDISAGTVTLTDNMTPEQFVALVRSH